MLCNKHTGRSQAVLLIATMVLASGLALTAWAKKPPPPPPEPASYTPAELGCAASGINDVGQVAGQMHGADGIGRACLLTPADCDGDGNLDWFWDGNADGINDLLEDLGTLPGDQHSYATAVNNFGQVVGDSVPRVDGGGFYPHAFMWDPQIGMIDLGALGGDLSWSQANAINGDGQVVGRAPGEGFPGGHAVLWVAGKTMVDLGTLGGPESEALSINESGQVVGSADTRATDREGRFIEHAFLITPEYDDDGKPVLWFRDDGNGGNALMIDLGTLGGPQSRAAAINDSGKIAGTGQIDANTGHAFLLTPEYDSGEGGLVWFRDDGAGGNALMTDLGVLGGLTGSYSTDLNNDDQVIGGCMKGKLGNKNFVRKPCLWENGQIKDLGELIDSDIGPWATGINNAGQILTTWHILLPIP